MTRWEMSGKSSELWNRRLVPSDRMQHQPTIGDARRVGRAENSGDTPARTLNCKLFVGGQPTDDSDRHPTAGYSARELLGIDLTDRLDRTPESRVHVGITDINSLVDAPDMGMQDRSHDCRAADSDLRVGRQENNMVS